jgi:Zn-dependent protease/predicted transcriptional regulator
MSQSTARPDMRRPPNSDRRREESSGSTAGTLALGRIGGVPVRAHWSVLIVTALIAWGLAAQALPGLDPGRPRWAYAVVGVVAAVLFVLGLLAHEVSHAVVARHSGVEVDSITLWLFGGVAQLHGEAKDPHAELRIAGVGPLVSLLLGVAFWIVAIGLSAAGVPEVVVGACTWLAGINVLLAVFNVLPGAPLDGGRLLRAVLWQRSGDRVRASISAARAGRGLGVALIAAGLAEFLLLNSFAGIWLAFIGWFIVGSAGLEERSARLGAALTGVRVGDVMTRSPETVPAGITVAELIDRYLFTRRHTSFPIVDVAGHPVGLITLARIKAVPAAERATTRLEDVAHPLDRVPLVAPGDQLAPLLPRLTGEADGRALVLDDGRLVGIITPSDLTRVIEAVSLRS